MSACELPSGSTVTRAVTCPPSLALPQITEPAGEAAAGGTAMGEFLQRVTAVGRDAALAEVKDDADRAVFAQIQTDTLPLHAPGGKHERAVAYDPWSGEVLSLGFNIGRAYKDAEWCKAHGVDRTRHIVMSLDYDWPDVAHKGKHNVCDWKRGQGAWLNTPLAANNWQAKLGAMVMARLTGAEVVQSWIVRVNENGFVDWSDSIVMDELDVMAAEAQFRGLLDHVRRVWEDVRVHGKVPDVTTGRHCLHCKAHKACPSTTALIQKIKTERISTDLSWFEKPEDLLLAIEMRDRTAKIEKDLHAELKAWTDRHGPVPLANGQVWGPRIIGNGNKRYEAHFPKS